jgi:polysaccharide export outer membrane protein
MTWKQSLALIALCTLIGCEPFTSPLPGEPSVDMNHYSSGDYKIGPEDVVEVIVWRNTDLTKTVAVRPDGKISLPLVGDVMALGKTPAELTKEIGEKLKEYKENPNVSVVVQQVNSYSVYVLGEVVHPGRYQLKSYSTVLQAISLAGGFTPYASKNKMFVLRKLPDRDTEVRIPVDYEEIISGQDSTQNTVLVPGDTVVVP